MDAPGRHDASTARYPARNCCGGFVDPAAELFAGRADPDESETLFRSESGLSQLSQNFISIDGDVIVQQGARTIENNLTTSINRSENTVLMDGDVIFREPGLMLRGSSAFIDSDDQLNRIETAQYVLHDFDAHGTASSVVYSSTSGQVAMKTVNSAAANRATNSGPSADSIVLDQEINRGYARKASIRVRDFPIFYYPFTLPFPLGEARASGLLPPVSAQPAPAGSIMNSLTISTSRPLRRDNLSEIAVRSWRHARHGIPLSC